jgi:hypothetical protein
MNNQDNISESFETVFRGIFRFFDADTDPGSGILNLFDPGSGMETEIQDNHPGSATLLKTCETVAYLTYRRIGTHL